MAPEQLVKEAVGQAQHVLRSIADFEPAIIEASRVITSCLLSGGKILACGNGGSAADAADFTTEFACKFVSDRRPYPALNLSQGGSLLTAIGNDYGFDEVFARQIAGFADKEDVLVAISTSGNSANVGKALGVAHECGVTTIALLGRTGGLAAGLADIEIIVASDSTARIQEAHKFILHVICEICEAELGSR